MKRTIMNIMKMLIVLFAALNIFALGNAYVTVVEAAETKAEDFQYEETDTGLTITGYIGTETDVVIPSEINGKKVTGIGDLAFSACGLTSIEIPASVTSIGDGAFCACPNLKSIVVSVGNKNYKSIDGMVYSYDMTNFVACPGGKRGELVIQKGVTHIRDYACTGCGNITSIKFPSGVTHIGYCSFSNCNSITSISFPEGLISIKDYAFVGCQNLTNVTIPASVTSMHTYSFDFCENLTNITVSKNNKKYSFKNGILYNKDFTNVIMCAEGIKGKVEVPEGVTSIGFAAFSACSNVTSVTLPGGVTSIGGIAFCECSSLTSIEIPSSVTTIEDDAFYGCDKLVIICEKDSYAYSFAKGKKIPVKIAEKVKRPAGKGTTFTITKNNIKVKVTSTGTSNPTVAVTKIANSSAKKVTIPASVTVDGVTYKVTKVADNAFKGNKKLTTVTIGSNVTSIGKNAFSGCTALTKVTIGKNVTTIGEKAFYKCTKLASVTIPDKVKKIGSSAFSGCTSLTKATIGKSVTSIEKNAFYGCKKLKTITIKSSKLKTIGKNAFKGINKKATITLKGTKKANTALKKKLKKSSVGYVKTWKIK